MEFHRRVPRRGNLTGIENQVGFTLDPSRTFTLKIKEFTPSAQLAWGDALGARVYSLTETNDGQTRFEMVERIGGPVFPLFANKIPSFEASFAQFTADLKSAAERVH